MKTVLSLTELRRWLGRTYPTARQLSDAANITTAGASTILKGPTRPTPRTLEKLGVKTVYQIPSPKLPRNGNGAAQ